MASAHSLCSAEHICHSVTFNIAIAETIQRQTLNQNRNAYNPLRLAPVPLHRSSPSTSWSRASSRTTSSSCSGSSGSSTPTTTAPSTTLWMRAAASRWAAPAARLDWAGAAQRWPPNAAAWPGQRRGPPPLVQLQVCTGG